MPEVRDLMKKGDELAIANEGSSVAEIAKIMADRNVGTVLITDTDGHLSGLITDRKITTEIVAKKKTPRTPIKELMTENLVVAKANNPVCTEVQHMNDESIRRIPVVGDTGQLLGVLSIADVAQHARGCDACADRILQIETRYV